MKIPEILLYKLKCFHVYNIHYGYKNTHKFAYMHAIFFIRYLHERMQSISNSIPQSYIKVSFNNSPRTTVTNTQNVQLIKRKCLSTHLIKGKEEQTSIRTKQTDTGKETARGRISPIHRARLDPLHLPRAPTLRHNVSLCHGRLSSLLSLERFNSAGSHSSLTHTENLVCGILDFGNSSN